ncbi:MAG: folate family ECF transporter S component [Clostridiales bacterium]|nr:folate family ECF transporter S component [Clostridiales bacterium]
MTNTVRKITILGMLLAAQVVAGLFVSISLPIAKIGFIFLPIAITGILYGPIWCGLSAAVGDIIIAMLGPYGYFPPMTISALLSGIIYGIFLYRKKANTARILVCVLTESILISVILQTFWLTLLTGKAYLVLLPARLLQNLIVIPVSVICIRIVAYRIVGLLPKTLFVPPVQAAIPGHIKAGKEQSGGL